MPFHAGGASKLALIMLPRCAASGDRMRRMLRAQFRMTEAEADIAMALGQGRELEEIAKTRGVSVNTLRSPIASIMTKTETHHRAELVALLSSLDSVI